MAKANLIKDTTLKKLLARGVETNKDQITASQNGDKTVLAFANEKLVFYIANGFPAAGYIPLRETSPPTP